MPIVTGNLTDVGLGHLVGLNPEVEFTLNAPNVSGSNIFATRPQAVAVPSSGAFSLTLADNMSMRDESWYTMRVRWQEPGRPNETGWAAVDIHDWKIIVPASGGSISDLTGGALPSNMRFVYVSLTAPAVTTPFLLWLQQDPNSPNSPASTGNLYELRNV